MLTIVNRIKRVERTLVEDAGGFAEPLRRGIEKVVVGRSPLIVGLLIGLLTEGHVLTEGALGLAKTLSVRTLAAAMMLTSRRIQSSPVTVIEAYGRAEQ